MACPEGMFGGQEQQWLGNLMNQAAPMLQEFLGPVLAQAAQHQPCPGMAGATNAGAEHPWMKMFQNYQDMMQKKDHSDESVWTTKVSLKGFSPEEVHVKVDPDERLIKIHAQHESGDESGFDRREAARYIRVPDDVVPESIKVSHQVHGYLTVSGRNITKETKEENGKTDERTQSSGQEKSAESSTPRKQDISEIKKDEEVKSGPKKFQFHVSREAPTPTKKDKNEKFLVELDVSKFKPEQLAVKISDHQLIITAADGPEVPEDNRKSSLNRKFTIPSDVNPDRLKSTLSPEGVLRVTLPEHEETEVAIELE